MALSIKNDATEHLAREVAKETGESITEAIRRALEERWKRLQLKRRSGALKPQLEELLNRVDGLPTVDKRSEDEILGYDENGIPR